MTDLQQMLHSRHRMFRAHSQRRTIRQPVYMAQHRTLRLPAHRVHRRMLKQSVHRTLHIQVFREM